MVPGIDSTYSLSSILSLGLIVPELLNPRVCIGKKPDVRTWIFYCAPYAVEKSTAEKFVFCGCVRRDECSWKTAKDSQT